MTGKLRRRSTRLLLHWRTALATALCALACSQLGLAQGTPPTILRIDTENQVQYFEDTFDLSRFVTDQGVTRANRPRNFEQYVAIGDIVAVNGQPAKGTFTNTSRTTNQRTAPNPGQAISDTVRNSVNTFTFEILQSDGTPIGTIIASGLGVGSAPPGAPLDVSQHNMAIVGGTGAFLGARGQVGAAVTPQTIAARQASITEDPANRRNNGGGRARFVLYVIPSSRPEIVATTHAHDFSLVTESNPARSGEILTLWATDLGPTRPGVNPGQPFPASPLPVVNSPVEVSVNGAPAEVLYAGGYPGSINGYQINLRLPAGITPGLASLQVSVAWIAGAEVKIAIQ